VESIEVIKWVLIAFVPAFILPLMHTKIRTAVLSRGGKLPNDSRSVVRDDPGQLLIMTALFGVPATLLLRFLNGPESLIIIILGVTAVMLVISLVNIKYRASFHVSMVTSMLTSLYILFGPALLFTFVVIPILGLSRYQLSEHTPMQILTGFLIGVIVGGVVYSYLGLSSFA
jgi:hypothetical protein